MLTCRITNWHLVSFSLVVGECPPAALLVFSSSAPLRLVGGQHSVSMTVPNGGVSLGLAVHLWWDASGCTVSRDMPTFLGGGEATAK